VYMATAVSANNLSHVSVKDSQAYPVRELSCVLDDPAACPFAAYPAGKIPQEECLQA
jgi:hypothetical protein